MPGQGAVGPGELQAHEHGQHPGHESHQHGGHVVLDPDDLVVLAEDVPPDEGLGRVGVCFRGVRLWGMGHGHLLLKWGRGGYSPVDSLMRASSSEGGTTCTCPRMR